MHSADVRSGLSLSKLLVCFIGLGIGALGVGLAIRSIGVSEEATDRPVPEPPPANDEPVPVPTPVSITPELTAASNANGQFAVALYQRLAEAREAGNVFLSPFSISTVLTMTAEGAVDQTFDQMADVLRIPKGSLEQIHRGQMELQRAVVPAVPSELTRKIADLRAELTATNNRTPALQKAGQFKDAYASYIAAEKLAARINTLVSRVSAYELRIANAIWLDQAYPIEPKFLSAVTSNYGTNLFPVDFKGDAETTRLHINQWVADQTNDRIQGLLSPGAISELTRMVLTNTVFFRSDWAKPFEPSQTRRERFRRSDGRSVELDMMQQWNYKSASYAAFKSGGELFPTLREVPIEIKDDDPSLYPDAKGHTMVALDYQGKKIQMICLLPQSVTGLSDLEKSLTYENLQRWIHELEFRHVNVSIPKFKLTSHYQLKEALRSLGMVRSFEVPKESGEGAQFEKLTSTQQLTDRPYISDVVHQTYLDVNELGTEAAAATALNFVGEDAFDRPKTRPFTPIFKADRPFLFLIRDRETSSILFMGRFVGTTP